jgi:cobaltochelatase CobT
VMMVLSDGQPSGGGRGDQHLATVVRDLTKQGIECIGIGILDASVKAYYPKAVVLRRVDELPGQVMSEIKRLLTA